MAARMTYDLTDEPTGDLYRSLLDFALTHCTEALLVTGRGELPLSILTLLDTLGPHLIASGERRDWPGTKLLSGGAKLWTYRYGGEVAEVLKDATTGLYRWQQPDLPEDLCLLRGPGNVWLGSVAHEAVAWLELTDAEASSLTTALPALTELLAPRRRTGTELSDVE